MQLSMLMLFMISLVPRFFPTYTPEPQSAINKEKPEKAEPIVYLKSFGSDFENDLSSSLLEIIDWKSQIDQKTTLVDSSINTKHPKKKRK